MVILFIKVSACAVVIFNLCIFQVDILLLKKGVSCKIPIFTSILLIFGKNFINLLGYIVYLKFYYVPSFFYPYVFQFDALLWKKGVLVKYHGKRGLNAKNAIFTNISFSFCQNFIKLTVTLFNKSFNM